MSSYKEKLIPVRNPYLQRTLEDAIGSAIYDIKGEVYYVDSNTGASTNGGKSWDNAMATVDQAINKCTANRGDIILIAPNHAEDIDANTDLVPDVDGVYIIGLGEGTDRPTFTFKTDTGANIPISGDNVTIKNILCISDIDSIVAGITVSGSDADLDFTWRDVTDKEAITIVLTTADADRLKLKLKVEGQTGGDAQVSAVKLIGVDSGQIQLDYYGKSSTSVVEFHTTACTNIQVKGFVYNSGTSDYSKTVVDTVTGSTWALHYFDGEAGNFASGGQDSAVAGDDISAVSSALTTLQGEISGATGIATFPASAVPANNVSLAEVIRDIWDVLRNGTGGTEPGTNRSIIDEIAGSSINFESANFLELEVDMSSATWNTVATHEVFNVSGAVRMRTFVVCSEDIAGGGTIQYGDDGDTTSFIAATTGTDIDQFDLWYDATPTLRVDDFTTVMFDKIIYARDVGYEILTSAFTDGTLTFYCWWEPLRSGSTVTLGDGSTL